jgi:hypothetical protein
MRDLHAIHVVLRDGCGRYLAGQRNSWHFTENFSQARIFDFIKDRIAEQVEQLSRDQSLVLSVVAVDPTERYEVCDVCGNRMMPYSTFFDGKNYFCRDCAPLQGKQSLTCPS